MRKLLVRLEIWWLCLKFEINLLKHNMPYSNIRKLSNGIRAWAIEISKNKDFI